MQSSMVVRIAISIVVFIILAVVISRFAHKPASQEASASPSSAAADTGELKVEDIKTGTGKEATNGAKITVHYTGTLTDGTKFDSSKDHGQPFSFTLGQGKVIQGWDLGLAGMKVGGERKLTIPAALGYKDQAAGTIPPNSTLIFDVELLDVQ